MKHQEPPHLTTVEFYYDFRSPFAYFATHRLGLLTEKGAEIIWRPAYVSVLLNLQLNAEPWEERDDPLPPPKRAHFMADIFRLIEFWKIPFNIPNPGIPECNQAMAIAALLEQKGIAHDEFHDAVFRAVWQEQKDGADPDVLRECLAAGNHDAGLMDQAQEKGVDLLTQNTIAAYERGVFGTPTFVVGEDLYFGADRMELIASRL
jgi:2-hydroxychromene-2-carboxylate isomerase